MRSIWVLLLCQLSFSSVICTEESYEEGSGEDEPSSRSNQYVTPQLVQRVQPVQAILPITRSSDDPTYPSIINASIDILLEDRPKPEKIRNVLMKYYFTDKESMSIWPKAIKDTEKTLNLEFDERQLSEMENDVKIIYRRLLECELLHGKKKKRLFAKCCLTLGDYIDDGFTDFGYPRSNIEAQARLLQMNVAYNMMSLLLLRMSQRIADSAGVKSFSAAKSIFDIAENVVSSVRTVTKETIDARIQAVSQIEICLMEEVLWQEFQVSCEFRQDTSDQARTKREVDTGAGIGGTSDKFSQRYRAKVIDAVTKKEVCNLELSTSKNMDKAAVKAELTKKCAKLRDTYARKVKTDIKNFYSGCTLPVAEYLPKLWKSDTSRLKQIKTKLDLAA